MKKHTFLRQHVFHDGMQMIVAKAGDKFAVPDESLDDFVLGKIIEKPKGWSHPDWDQAEDEGEFESAGFTMKHVGFGKFEITGPGLEQPETVKGRDVAESRMAQLAKGGPASRPNDAPPAA